MGADDQGRVSAHQSLQQSGTGLALVPTGQQQAVQAGRRGQGLDRRIVLPGKYLRRRHQGRLGAAFDGPQHGENGNHGLAAADIALQQPHHPALAGHVGGDIAPGFVLGFRQGEGQGGDGLVDQAAVSVYGAPLDPALVEAHQAQRQLIGKQFVIGEALARSRAGLQVRLGFRGVDAQQGLPPGGPAIARQMRRIQPFRQLRRAFEGKADRLADGFQGESRGQAVDRLDGHDALGLGQRRDVVRMGHLQAPAEGFHPAADDPAFPLRELFLEIALAGVEEDQLQLAVLVGAEHPVGLTRRMPRLVLDDAQRDRGDPARFRAIQRRGIAPVDQAVGQVPAKIDDLVAAQQGLEQLRKARADTAERGDLGKKRIE